MILYFVRHGETDFNKKHLLQGKEFDEPLNETGVKQMNELLPSLPADFEVIFSPSLKRVLTSAEIIRDKFHKPIIINENISEKSFGSLAGKTWSDIPGGQLLREIERKQQYDYRPYGGESVEDVKGRINKFLQDAKSSNYKVALVVSSLGILRLIYKLLLKKDVLDIANATVHKFEI